jgi:hypothetical protein
VVPIALGRDDTFSMITVVSSPGTRTFELFTVEPGALPGAPMSAIIDVDHPAASMVPFSDRSDHLQFCYFPYGAMYFGLRAHHGHIYLEDSAGGYQSDSEQLASTTEAAMDLEDLVTAHGDRYGVAWIDGATLKVRRWWKPEGGRGDTATLATDAQPSAGLSMARQDDGSIVLAYATRAGTLVVLRDVFGVSPARTEHALPAVHEIAAVKTVAGGVDVFVIAGATRSVHVLEQNAGTWSQPFELDVGPARDLHALDAYTDESLAASVLWRLHDDAYLPGGAPFPQDRVIHVKEIAGTWTGAGWLEVSGSGLPEQRAFAAQAIAPFRTPSALAVLAIAPTPSGGVRTQVLTESRIVVDQGNPANTTWKFWTPPAVVARAERYPTPETAAYSCARTHCFCPAECRAAFATPGACVPTTCAGDCIAPGHALCEPPAAPTCSGADATASAQVFVVLAEGAGGCADGVALFANTADEARQCVRGMGLAPVDRICGYDVLLESPPPHHVYPTATSDANARTCAKIIGGCANCSPQVVQTVRCVP